MVKIHHLVIPILFLATAFSDAAILHDRNVKHQGEVVFIGDSITYFWIASGWQSWAEHYLPHGAVNVGWPGDWSSNTIDKINNQGIIDNLNSRVAVLMIGTNDLAGGASENSVVENIYTITVLIKDKMPDCKILLLGILPRNDAEIHRKARIVNAAIANFDDNQRVFFLDMDAQFSTGLGILKPGIYEDGVHLNANGYALFAQTMNPTFLALLENGPVPTSTPPPPTTTPGPPSGVVFLGDSITYFWREHGLATWNQFYEPLGAVNTGWPGDWTTTTIDKINNQGIIDNLNAKLAVLMIGTNDLSGWSPETTIADNIRTIINLVRSKNPSCKILLLGVFPRDGAEIHQRVRNVNAIISGFADNQIVYFLNMESEFSNGLGTVKPDLYYDGLHLTSEGYVVWARTMNPTFDAILNGSFKSKV